MATTTVEVELPKKRAQELVRSVAAICHGADAQRAFLRECEAGVKVSLCAFLRVLVPKLHEFAAEKSPSGM